MCYFSVLSTLSSRKHKKQATVQQRPAIFADVVSTCLRAELGFSLLLLLTNEKSGQSFFLWLAQREPAHVGTTLHFTAEWMCCAVCVITCLLIVSCVFFKPAVFFDFKVGGIFCFKFLLNFLNVFFFCTL